MSIWKKQATPAQFNAFSENTLVSHLDIKITEIGDDYIKGTMPVKDFTRQPMGYLHGGASVVLAETLGSIAGHLVVGDEKNCFGVEINANHLRSVKEGMVTATVRPIRIGSTLHVWDIQITDERDELICVSRLTLAVKDFR